MFSDSSTSAATFAALLMVFVSRGVSGQSTSLSPILSVTPSSMSTLPTSSQDISTTTSSATAASTVVISSTPSGPSTNASVTTTNPTSEAMTEAPTTTEAPSSTKTCGWVIVVWKKSWNSMYKDNQQFISNTTEKLQMFLEHDFFNDSSKYGHVKVSDLQVDDKDGDINVTFKLCLVLKNNAHAGYIEDVIKMWKKFGNESITGHKFLAGE
ncbi:unnamed protein product [Porites evermanni]|uniref:Uncharacterized protein n=1 Tax=Porites evermanni TaxID=104178 RepID=A0ABN8SS79_9CNID|nr:unnamed protein product [Porites evermanni]